MSHAILPTIPLPAIEDAEEMYKALEALRDKLEAKLKAVEAISNTASASVKVDAVIEALVNG